MIYSKPVTQRTQSALRAAQSYGRPSRLHASKRKRTFLFPSLIIHRLHRFAQMPISRRVFNLCKSVSSVDKNKHLPLHKNIQTAGQSLPKLCGPLCSLCSFPLTSFRLRRSRAGFLCPPSSGFLHSLRFLLFKQNTHQATKPMATKNTKLRPANKGLKAPIGARETHAWVGKLCGKK